MLARLRMFWVRARDSLWFLPGVLTLAAAVLALGMLALERRGFFPAALADDEVLAVGVEGARGVLAAIASGLITVTGVVFSVTIVALQLASTQFTPRVLRNFTADRANQMVLGVFIATFTYTLLVLRAIRSGEEEGGDFVPRLAVALAVVMVLVSIAFLIFFINHAARSIQASTILARVTGDTLKDVYRLFPEQVGPSDPERPPDPRLPDAPSAPVRAAKSGYLQAVDGGALFQLGERRSLVIAMEPYVGSFVLAGQPLVRVFPPEEVDEEVVSGVRTAFVLGPERTPEQDAEFGIIEISDIAVKALSPGINDPTTAMHCLDRLGEILLALGTRAPPRDERTREGRVHFITRHLEFERAVGLAFDPILHYGAGNPAVVKKVLAVLSGLEGLVAERNRAPILAQARAALRAARAAVEHHPDRVGVEELAERMGL